MSRKGMAGLEVFLLFSIIVTAAALSILGFTYFFKYRVRVTISSDATSSKSSVIPLSLVTVTNYGNCGTGEFVMKLTQGGGFKDCIKEVTETLTKATGVVNLLCFRMKMDGTFEIDTIDEACETRLSYRNYYPVPIIFDGSDLAKKLEFITYPRRPVPPVGGVGP